MLAENKWQIAEKIGKIAEANRRKCNNLQSALSANDSSNSEAKLNSFDSRTKKKQQEFLD